MSSSGTEMWGPEPTPGELAAARAFGMAAKSEALAIALDGALTLSEAAKRLGLDEREVVARIAAGELLAIGEGAGRRCPAWQFRRRSSLPGLADLIAAWPGGDLALSLWAMRPCPDLGGRSPDELARRHGLRRVLAAVEPLTPAGW